MGLVSSFEAFLDAVLLGIAFDLSCSAQDSMCIVRFFLVTCSSL